MADNVGVTPGSGATIATDEVSGVQFQIVKLDIGGDGVSVPVVAGQQLAAASLPVVLASDKTVGVVGTGTFAVQAEQSGAWVVSGAVTVSGSVAVAGTVDATLVDIGGAATEATLAAVATEATLAAVATEATLATLSQAQGSTTSGQKGPLVQGAVGTTAPSYTDAQSSPISLTPSGSVRVQIHSAGTPISAGSGSDTNALRVIPSSGATIPVTNAGTFAVQGGAATPSADITRPADTTAYTANDALSDSTSAPTSGGFTLSNAARISGGAGIISDLVVVSSNSPATLLQGEIWIFNQAVTAINDNAAFALSDSDVKNLVGVIPFTLADAGGGANSYACVTSTFVPLAFVCVGSANLRFLVKVKNAYTPANAEVLTVRAKVIYTN